MRTVAQKCGIALPKREFSSPEEAARAGCAAGCWSSTRQATQWFEEQLKRPEGARAREYLTGRGLKPETIQKFRIGYAPDGFNALRERLAGAAPPDVLRASGLFSSRSRRTSGNSADASMTASASGSRFPSRTRAGEVIAFTARALDTGRKGRRQVHELAGDAALFQGPGAVQSGQGASSEIRQRISRCWWKGRWTASRCTCAGSQNVLATSGTAFTEQQVRLLRRYTHATWSVNFDPDTAGANAAEKSIALLTEEGFEVRDRDARRRPGSGPLRARARHRGIHRRRCKARYGTRTT